VDALRHAERHERVLRRVALEVLAQQRDDLLPAIASAWVISASPSASKAISMLRVWPRVSSA
jgi:hypothetical protein